MKLSDLTNASEATKRRNPQLFGALAGLPNPISKPEGGTALVTKTRRTHRRISRVKVRVSIVSVRRRLLDSDNLVAGAKQIRDVIAEKLESSDAEGSGIEWAYHQILSRWEQGTIVKLEVVPE